MHFTKHIPLLALSLLISVQADAQVLYGNLVGNVTEATQAVVPGAEVTIVNEETNLTRRVLTNETGSFSFPNLVAGPYTVTVKRPGFADSVAKSIVVGQNSTVRHDVVLQGSWRGIGGDCHCRSRGRTTPNRSR